MGIWRGKVPLLIRFWKVKQIESSGNRAKIYGLFRQEKGCAIKSKGECGHTANATRFMRTIIIENGAIYSKKWACYWKSAIGGCNSRICFVCECVGVVLYCTSRGRVRARQRVMIYNAIGHKPAYKNARRDWAHAWFLRQYVALLFILRRVYDPLYSAKRPSTRTRGDGLKYDDALDYAARMIELVGNDFAKL